MNILASLTTFKVWICWWFIDVSLFSRQVHSQLFKIQVHVYSGISFYLEDSAYMGPQKRLKTDAEDQ